MNAADIINELIKAGVAIKDVAARIPRAPGGAVDYVALLNSVMGDPQLSATVKDLWKALPKDMNGALKEIEAKQAVLLRGRKVSELTPGELLDYSELADTRLVLATQQLVQSLNPSVLEWFMKEALPTLTSVAPVVIKLLL